MDGFFGSSGGGNNIQYLVMPTASKSLFDAKTIIQYKGVTDETYTNGYFYKCVETDGVYSWQNISVQDGGGSPTQVALLSITTAPSGSFAVGSKYYNSSTKKIVTAVTADTWVGATSADPVFNVIYTYDSGYYIWDGDTLESTDLNLYEKVANKSNSYTVSSETTYASSKALVDGLGTKVDRKSVV